MSLADFFRYAPAGFLYLLALAAQVSGYASPLIAILLATAGTVWLIGHWVHKWHQRRKTAGKAGVEPSHIIAVCLVCGTIFYAGAAGAYIWQQFFSHTASQGLEESRIVTPPLAELDNAKQQVASLQSQLTAAIKERDDARLERDADNQKFAFLTPMAIRHETSSQEPSNKIDDAIKLSIWEGVSTSNVNALAGTYNMIDYPLTQWLDWVKSADGRKKLSKELGNGAVAYMTAANNLEKLREEYQNYQDVVGVLAPQPNRADFAKALVDFSTAISSIPSDMPPNYETKLRPLAGALRRELDTTSGWLQTLRHTADEKQKELSRKSEDR